jgi:hypothetical protein
MKPRTDAEPGTGTQYYTEATMDPRRDPSFDDDVTTRDAQRWRSSGRTWVCGRHYIDVVMKDVAVLDSVIRKSPWCSNTPAEEGTLYLVFDFKRSGQLEYQFGRPDEDPNERFLERYRDSVNRGP